MMREILCMHARQRLGMCVYVFMYVCMTIWRLLNDERDIMYACQAEARYVCVCVCVCLLTYIRICLYV
jgi:hypothetical protein